GHVEVDGQRDWRKRLIVGMRVVSGSRLVGRPRELLSRTGGSGGSSAWGCVRAGALVRGLGSMAERDWRKRPIVGMTVQLGALVPGFRGMGSRTGGSTRCSGWGMCPGGSIGAELWKHGLAGAKETHDRRHDRSAWSIRAGLLAEDGWQTGGRA